MREQL